MADRYTDRIQPNLQRGDSGGCAKRHSDPRSLFDTLHDDWPVTRARFCLQGTTMTTTTPEQQPEAPRHGDETLEEGRAKFDAELREERSATDASLRTERSVTDELLVAEREEQRLAEVVREGRSEAERVLREVRADSDEQLDKQSDRLPEISEKLEHVAEGLSKAAASLIGAASVLQESSDDLATNMAQIADELNGTASPAGAPVPRPAPPDPSTTLTGQLSEIAEGIAEITSTLSEERRDADESLREERQVTDRLIVHELKQVETKLGAELRQERQALRADRQTTDEDLAKERRNTDQAVEHVQELLAEERRDHTHTARAGATRNEFLGIVSHDLRGPLMTIASIAALMDQQAPADDMGQRMRGWAERVRRSLNVMERLISDLLDFNSFEDGQMRVAAECLDIRPVIRDAIDAFHDAAIAKGVSLDADLPADPLLTKHDPHRMLQVLSNLVHNAIKFTPEGGAIRIAAARAGAVCQVSVSDTGVGIANRDLAAIFERFRQLNPSDRSGLGLGLYISRWIVEAHGGRIWAESEVGVGTTFHIALPDEPSPTPLAM
jgi:signal transduction histidine kinase